MQRLYRSNLTDLELREHLAYEEDFNLWFRSLIQVQSVDQTSPQSPRINNRSPPEDLSLSASFENLLITDTMPALNLVVGAGQILYQSNLAAAIASIDTNFEHPNPLPPHESLAFAINYSTFQTADVMQNGALILVTSTANGPIPNVVNLSLPGQFQLVVLKVTSIGVGTITLIRSVALSDNASAVSADANADATYGPLGSRIYFRLPQADGAAAPRFLVANESLVDLVLNQDPDVVPIPLVPVAPAIPVAAAPPPNDGIIQQIVNNQNNLLAESRNAVAKNKSYERFLALERLLPAGRHPIFLESLMFGRPDGQPSCSGYLSTSKLNSLLRDRFFDHSNFLARRTVTITDAKLESLLKLEFAPTTLRFEDLATPSDLPITIDNIKSFMQRICEHIAVIFGAPLAHAILRSIDQLVEFIELSDMPGLTVPDILVVTERKLFLAPKFPPFDITIAPNGLSLEQNLRDLFHCDRNDSGLWRMINSRAQDVQNLSAAATNPNNPRQNRKRGSATVVPTQALLPAAPQTRATKAASDKIALTAWHAELTTNIPALVNIPLPCLYWLANVAPCNQSTTCNKQTHKKPHVLPPVMQPHKAAILTWLKKDPLGRF